MTKMLNFGGNVKFKDQCQVKFTNDEDCTNKAEYVIEQNIHTDRKVCRECLGGALRFALQYLPAMVVRKL